MPSNETHICIFCEGKMGSTRAGYYCKPCDAYKGYRSYTFTRIYKSRYYQFDYDIADQKFTLTCLGNDRAVMESHDLYLITPQNWQKKLPTILVFA